MLVVLELLIVLYIGFLVLFLLFMLSLLLWLMINNFFFFCMVYEILFGDK